jgi:UDP-glucose 4-epimerase
VNAGVRVGEKLAKVMSDFAPDAVIHFAGLKAVGAHPSDEIGEDPDGIPDNLMPYVAQVAVGRRPHLNVFGDDYNTRDGTGERDYIHVVDLAQAHVAALDFVGVNPGCEASNVGTGMAYSLLDVVAGYSEACGRDIPHVVNERSRGDVATSFAATTKAGEMLVWRAEHGLAVMSRSSLNWQFGNPKGYS